MLDQGPENHTMTKRFPLSTGWWKNRRMLITSKKLISIIEVHATGNIVVAEFENEISYTEKLWSLKYSTFVPTVSADSTLLEII